MSPETLFRIHLVSGYVAWLLCFSVYILPRLRSMDRIEAHRAIATLHSFRFFGLVFLLPGVVGTLPSGFAAFAAWGDFATGVLAMLALVTFRSRRLSLVLRCAPSISSVWAIFCRLLPRHTGRPSRDGWRTGRHICDPDHLCASAGDHPRGRSLLAGTSSLRGPSTPRGRSLIYREPL